MRTKYVEPAGYFSKEMEKAFKKASKEKPKKPEKKQKKTKGK